MKKHFKGTILICILPKYDLDDLLIRLLFFLLADNNHGHFTTYNIALAYAIAYRINRNN